MEERCIQMGTLREDIPTIGNYDRSRRFYDPKGLSPAITTRSGGGQEVKIGEDMDLTEGRDENGELIVEKRVRVRRLTPRECYRLMDFDDEDFDKAREVCSETALYKQAGNSIVVAVLEGIMRQLKPYFTK